MATREGEGQEGVEGEVKRATAEEEGKAKGKGGEDARRVEGPG